jgi:pimeloyl-ACP methyl ester carboxylesterase
LLQVARGDIDYDEAGSGPTILFVPGSWGTRSAWRAVIAALNGQFRIVATSLLGYGGTSERRTAADFSIEREAEIIEAVSRRAGGRVHLVGHSYGSQACIAVAIRGVIPLNSLCVIEPTGINILRRAGELALYGQMVAFDDAYFRAFENGDKEAARHVVDLHDGDGRFDALPSRVRDYITSTTATNILDWRSHLGWDAPLLAYSGIAVPGLVIRGGRGHPYIARSAEILSGAMPNAFLVTVLGAAHSMMTTHAAEVARLVGEHVPKAIRARMIGRFHPLLLPAARVAPSTHLKNLQRALFG